MATEAFQYINSLSANLPSTSDNLLEGDDHLRGIKLTLKNTFPNVAGQVTSAHVQLNSFVPIGGIFMWGLGLDSIPAGWCLCDGRTVARTDGAGNVTAPNLLDRFIVSAGSIYGVGATGGSATQTILTSTAGDHVHSGSTDVQGQHSHTGGTQPASLGPEHLPPHTHGIRTADGGSGLAGAVWASTDANSGIGSTEATGSSAPHAHGIYADGAHGHNLSLSNAGAHAHSVSFDNRPPFVGLAFIMKV